MDKKKYGKCYVCQKILSKYHLQKGSIKVCSFRCVDRLKAPEVAAVK